MSQLSSPADVSLCMLYVITDMHSYCREELRLEIHIHVGLDIIPLLVTLPPFLQLAVSVALGSFTSFVCSELQSELHYTGVKICSCMNWSCHGMACGTLWLWPWGVMCSFALAWTGSVLCYFVLITHVMSSLIRWISWNSKSAVCGSKQLIKNPQGYWKLVFAVMYLSVLVCATAVNCNWNPDSCSRHSKTCPSPVEIYDAICAIWRRWWWYLCYKAISACRLSSLRYTIINQLSKKNRVVHAHRQVDCCLCCLYNLRRTHATAQHVSHGMFLLSVKHHIYWHVTYWVGVMQATWQISSTNSVVQNAHAMAHWVPIWVVLGALDDDNGMPLDNLSYLYFNVDATGNSWHEFSAIAVRQLHHVMICVY